MLRKRLKKFLDEILPNYAETRNRPDVDGSSRLSAYLHFGFLSSLEIALAVMNAKAPKESKDAYLEELIVRRELAYNFTNFNPHYDSLESLPSWAKATMKKHASRQAGLRLFPGGTRGGADSWTSCGMLRKEKC